MTTWSEKNLLPPGTIVTGKWNGKKYTLQRLLGAGSNGQVYLAASGRSVCALKFGTESAELQTEANVLVSLDSVRRRRGKPPFLLDVDDFTLEGRDIPFYAMRYVPGTPLRNYLNQHGSKWVGVIGYKLLEMLSELHEAGWVFSDLKSDNILVHQYGRVELVDYGGATAIGRSVRQFTELYDRGYWSAGSRVAEPAYDWFAFGIVWLHALDSKRLMELSQLRMPHERSIEDLMKLVRTNDKLRPLEQWMESAFRGKFKDSRDALSQWRQIYWKSRPRKAAEVPAWMMGLLVVSAALCVSLAAISLLH